MEREKFGSRLGFILISAGCAIGLGNVWRFPYIVGENGGAAFILIYLLFLAIFGVPIMAMEFAVGRGSGKSLVESFKTLEPKGTKWHLFGWVGIAGNYLLMMFYASVTGWMIDYFVKMIKGDFVGLDSAAVSGQFGQMVSNPIELIVFMLIAVILGFGICSLGLNKGVEKITKTMMIALLLLISVLAIRSVTLEGAAEGVAYYLKPDFGKIAEIGLGDVVFDALGQSFFTLSIGMGSMAIFGSYISKERRLMGEAVNIAILDTFVAFMAGLIVIPACFAYGISPNAGPGLIFETLPNVFNGMAGGRFWGTLFFLFMMFAALSTVIAVFENIVSFAMDTLHWSRKKSCLINCILLIVLSLPCIFGFNIWSSVAPLGAGTNIMDLEDFIISNNILPIGSIVYVLFCTLQTKGWGWKNFIEEVNTGKGMKFPAYLKLYMKYVLPLIVLVLWIQGIISFFA